MQHVQLIDQRRQALKFFDKLTAQERTVSEPERVKEILSAPDYLLHSGFLTIRVRMYPPQHGTMINRRNRSQTGDDHS